MSFINKEYDLSISNIDYHQLNYQEIKWIYSSHMLQYVDEFVNLPGFCRYTYKLYFQNILDHIYDCKKNILDSIYDTFKYK